MVDRVYQRSGPDSVVVRWEETVDICMLISIRALSFFRCLDHQGELDVQEIGKFILQVVTGKTNVECEIFLGEL